MFRLALTTLSLVAATVVAGCDMLGIESPEKVAAAREAEGKAVGGACRHAGRAIEDCYTLNKRVDKAAIFAGWRDMNDYMRENKIEAVPPLLVAQVANPKVSAEGKDGVKAGEAKPADGDADKAPAKPRAKDPKGS